MSKTTSNLRTNLVLEILLNHSNANHLLACPAIIKILKEQYEITCDRRTIMRDIDTLNNLNYNIIYVHKGGKQGFYIQDSKLSLDQAKLIYDLIYSTQSISLNSSNEIIKKLDSLVKEDVRNLIKKQQYLNHNKASDINIKTNITKITNAIAANQVISFLYFDYYNKQKHYRYDAKRIIAYPYAMYIKDDRYYVLLELKETIKQVSSAYDLYQYRLDRMDNIIALPNTFKRKVTKQQIQQRLDSSIFAMQGKHELIRLQVANSLISAFSDKFNDVTIESTQNDTSIIYFDVLVNNPFYSYLLNFDANKVKILSPQSCIYGFKQHLKSHLSSY